MRRQVTGKQENSKMCLVCGLKNAHGLQAAFYELDNQDLLAVFTPGDEHQGYPNTLHGGITSAMLDETIGRAIMMRYEEAVWGMTVDLKIKFRKPIPLNQPLRVVGRITEEDRRFFRGTGELLLEDGGVAATAEGRYMRLPIERIADFDYEEQEWRVVGLAEDPTEVDL